MAAKCLILSLASLFLLTGGARIGVRSQVDSSSKSETQIGPEGETWDQNTKYVCMQKWQNPGWRSSEGTFVDKFCLAKYNDVLATNREHAKVTKEMSKCDSSNGKMKVCALKGEAPERRLSYSTKASVPKACFRESDVTTAYAVIEVALDETGCEEAMNLPAEQQMILPKLTTTTTTTETEFIEAKNLFTDELMWTYKDMSIKCCTSSAGMPTKLQDMNAAELPSERSFGSRTGCGRMFGDTYHDGLKGYKGAAPSCSVLASQLKEVTGEDYESIKSSLAPFKGLWRFS